MNQPTQAQQQQQEAQQRQQEQQAFQYSQAELKQLQAFQAFQLLQQQQQQQLQQQLNSTPIQQILQQQILNRFNQVQQMQSWRQPAANNGTTALDHAAKYHRSSAALYDASCTWSGVLPPRSHRFITYSPKVFLGGIPWDISEQTLMQILKPFGQIRIEWPGKEQNAAQPKGYVYVIFESEKQVKLLLQACSIQDNFSGSSSGESTGSIPSLCSSSVSGNTSGNYYYKISSKRIKEKEVEVIPWIIGDSNYIKNTNQKLDSTKTVFVGALHGKLTAEALAKIMNDLFDGVVYAGIDTDKYKYPIGSGRVTFNNMRSYMRAVSAAFIEIKTSKFTKKVQVDPYLEDSLCSMCGVQHGPYYCRELSCFRWEILESSFPEIILTTFVSFQLLLSSMLAASSLEWHSLAQSQAANAQLKDSTDRRRRSQLVSIILRQLKLGIFGQQSRIANITAQQWSQPSARLRLEVKIFR